MSILDEVAAERERQNAKWGEQNHPNVDVVLINRPSVVDGNGRTWPGSCTPQRMAEHYEIVTAGRAKFLTDHAASHGQCTWAHILIEEVAEAVEAATLLDQFVAAHGRPPEHDRDLRKELIQVAAVAVQWVEKLDRDRAAIVTGSAS